MRTAKRTKAPLQVQIHDVVIMATRTLDLPVRCANATCGKDLSDVGVVEVAVLDVGVETRIDAGSLVPLGETKYGDVYTTIGFECAACHHLLVGKACPEVQ